MAGMISQNRYAPSLTKGYLGSMWSDTNMNNGVVTRYDPNNLTFRQSTTSFRSGAAYESAINQGALVQPDDISSYGRLLGDTGHDFDTVKGSIFTDSGPNSIHQFKGSRGIFHGPMIPYPLMSLEAQATSTDYKSMAPKAMSNFVINEYASDLVNRASPLKSQANLLQSVLELLREGLPSALFSAISSPASLSKRGAIQALGSDYLNHMFAVSPLIRDIDNVARLVGRISDLATQLVNDSGNQIIRKRAIPTQEVNYPTRVLTSSTAGHFLPLSRKYLPNENGNGYVVANNMEYYCRSNFYTEGTTRDTTNVWFSGAFTYYIEKLRVPNGQLGLFRNTAWRGKATDKQISSEFLLGLRESNASSAMWWELTPFSWLVDWFVNVGSVLDNRHMFDDLGLVMNYGYVMVEQVRSTTTTIRCSDGQTFGSQVRFVRKSRRRANPFGFGVTDKALNPFQISILGALATNGLGSRK